MSMVEEKSEKLEGEIDDFNLADNQYTFWRYRDDGKKKHRKLAVVTVPEGMGMETQKVFSMDNKHAVHYSRAVVQFTFRVMSAIRILMKDKSSMFANREILSIWDIPDMFSYGFSIWDNENPAITINLVAGFTRDHVKKVIDFCLNEENEAEYEKWTLNKMTLDELITKLYGDEFSGWKDYPVIDLPKVNTDL